MVPPFHSQLDELRVGILQGLDPLHDDAGVAGTVALSPLFVCKGKSVIV